MRHGKAGFDTPSHQCPSARSILAPATASSPVSPERIGGDAAARAAAAAEAAAWLG